METSKDGVKVILGQIRASGGQKVSTVLHLFSKGFFVHSKTDGDHSSDGEAAVKKQFTPVVHDLRPFGETIGNVLRRVKFVKIFGFLSRSFANVPEISPFSVKRRRAFSQGLVAASHLFEHGAVGSGLFLEFGGGTDLIVILREDIINRFVIVEFLGSGVKELLHHVEDFVVVRLVDTRISDDEATSFFESLKDLLAVFEVRTFVGKERSSFNDGNALFKDGSGVHV